MVLSWGIFIGKVTKILGCIFDRKSYYVFRERFLPLAPLDRGLLLKPRGLQTLSLIGQLPLQQERLECPFNATKMPHLIGVLSISRTVGETASRDVRSIKNLTRSPASTLKSPVADVDIPQSSNENNSHRHQSELRKAADDWLAGCLTSL